MTILLMSLCGRAMTSEVTTSPMRCADSHTGIHRRFYCADVALHHHGDRAGTDVS